MKPVLFSEAKDIFRNEFLRLYSVQAEFGDHSKEYFVTERGTRVGVLLLRDHRVLLVRQYRFLINDYSWELPGGGVQTGELPEQAIRRECREEAGIVCRSIVPLFDYLLGTDVTDNHVHLFYSSDFIEMEEAGDGKETDARAWIPIAKCMQRAMNGELRDLMTIVGLLIYQCKKDALT